MISDELRSFIESGVAVVVSTADAEGHPHVAFAWGPRVLAEGGSVSFCLEAGRAEQVLEDVHPGSGLAITFGHPTTYRSVQLKGATRASSAATEADGARVAAHQDDFLSSTALVGDDPAVIRACWNGDEPLVRVEMDVARAFDQTPGPVAGREL